MNVRCTWSNSVTCVAHESHNLLLSTFFWYSSVWKSSNNLNNISRNIKTKNFAAANQSYIFIKNSQLNPASLRVTFSLVRICFRPVFASQLFPTKQSPLPRSSWFYNSAFTSIVYFSNKQNPLWNQSVLIPKTNPWLLHIFKWSRCVRSVGSAKRRKHDACTYIER